MVDPGRVLESFEICDRHDEQLPDLDPSAPGLFKGTMRSDLHDLQATPGSGGEQPPEIGLTVREQECVSIPVRVRLSLQSSIEQVDQSWLAGQTLEGCLDDELTTNECHPVQANWFALWLVGQSDPGPTLNRWLRLRRREELPVERDPLLDRPPAPAMGTDGSDATGLRYLDGAEHGKRTVEHPPLPTQSLPRSLQRLTAASLIPVAQGKPGNPTSPSLGQASRRGQNRLLASGTVQGKRDGTVRDCCARPRGVRLGVNFIRYFWAILFSLDAG